MWTSEFREFMSKTTEESTAGLNAAKIKVDSASSNNFNKVSKR